MIANAASSIGVRFKIRNVRALLQFAVFPLEFINDSRSSCEQHELARRDLG
jgi:hypothetical protein